MKRKAGIGLSLGVIDSAVSVFRTRHPVVHGQQCQQFMPEVLIMARRLATMSSTNEFWFRLARSVMIPEEPKIRHRKKGGYIHYSRL